MTTDHCDQGDRRDGNRRGEDRRVQPERRSDESQARRAIQRELGRQRSDAVQRCLRSWHDNDPSR